MFSFILLRYLIFIFLFSLEYEVLIHDDHHSQEHENNENEHGEERKIEIYDEALESLLTTPPLHGLSSDEVTLRLQKFGHNGKYFL